MITTAQLLSNKDLTQAYIDIVSVIVVVLDADGRVLLINAKGCASLERTRDELIGNNWFDLVIPERLRSGTKLKYQKMISGEEPLEEQYEIIVFVKSGEERTLSWSPVLLKESTGKNIGIIGSGQDVTDRKKTEALLKESADQFRSYVENAPFGIFVCDELGHYQEVNPKATTMLGYTREELLEMSIPEILPVESQEYGLHLFQTVIEVGRGTGEFSFKRKDGQIGTWLIEAVKLSPKRFMAFVVDTTERNRLEQLLKTEREEQQVILDSIPGWIFYKDIHNSFLRVNKAFCDVIGKSKKQLEGISLFDIFSKDQADAYWKDDLEVIASRKPKRNIIELMTTPKGILWVQTDKIPLLDNNGNIKGILGFSVDITMNKKAEEKLALYAQDLEKMNQLMIGRELKMVELKNENSQLQAKLGKV